MNLDCNRTLLQKYIESRLEDYNYSHKMDPAKYNSYAAVRRVISLRLGLKDGREQLDDDQLIQAYRLVDEVLPARKEPNMDKALNLPLTQEEANIALVQIGSRIDFFIEELTIAGSRSQADRCMEISGQLTALRSIQTKLQKLGATLEV